MGEGISKESQERSGKYEKEKGRVEHPQRKKQCQQWNVVQENIYVNRSTADVRV